ncbi:outer membrane beta-barrel family protein [Compostibacter hankyongensis]|uniref:Outer membrane beta-barrel family protein n=1 Tax=Compostibacter hankyongensis TaxID=1007089 RepID=A0ABP8FRL2_9BACT
MRERKIFLVVIGLWLLCPFVLKAQQPGGPGGGAQNGHAYGKVFDAKSGKPVGFATVGILRAADSGTVTGVLSKENGSFDVEKLAPGKYLLRINFVGYDPLYKSFSITPQSSDRDLGNLKISQSTHTLEETVVTADKSAFNLAIDKKVFNVEKSLVSKGGTATDALRQVPTVNVDVDGNVTLRNGTPTIFVDGRESPLTLDQIPSDEIQDIEIITNPSAKYDASGMSGIINVILKKDRKPGINGMVMGGLSNQPEYNGGASLNIYKKPFNLSLNYFANYRKRTHKGTTSRQNLSDGSFLDQKSDETGKGPFQVGRIGLDYFMDNRNTFNIQGAIGGGNNTSDGMQYNTYSGSGKVPDSSSIRDTREDRTFHFLSGELNYTHDFVKEKEQLTAQASIRRFKGPGSGTYQTTYFGEEGEQLRDPFLQQYESGGSATLYDFQSDYTNPLRNGKAKLEAGVRARISDSRNYSTMNNYDDNGKEYVKDPLASYDYKFQQRTYAAYLNYADKFGKFGYQAGLRFEQYENEGRMLDSNYSFSYSKPGFFPSLFLTQQLGQNENQQLQLNYSRRIERPDFWQLSPRIDYEDPQNLRQGNPELLPEYTNSFEFSYNNVFGSTNLLATLYFRNTNNLITSYVIPISKDTLLSTYVNANTSNTYGAEITLKTALTNWWDVTANVNVFQTDIDASKIQSNLSNSGFSGFGKLNSETRLPKNFVVQLTGEYEAPRVIPQGKIRGNGSMDIALRKDFLKNRAASLTLSLSDIFNTEQRFTHTVSEGYFIQDATRKRMSRVFKINFSYRFGKQDVGLFKRKAKTKSQQGGGDNNMMMDQGGGDMN